MLKARLVLFIYQLLTFFLAPLGMLYLIYKKRRDPPYGKRKWELLGFMPVSFRGSIWFHTVSVGEVIAARPIITAFAKRHPWLNIVVTTTTTTGAAQAAKIPGVTHLYAPLDSPTALYRFFKAVKPRQLFIMETELWPNLLHRAQKERTQVTIFNARMPEHTCKAYEKHRALIKALIADKLNLVICQTKEDKERFIRIGVPPERLHVVNSLKYDLSPNETKFAAGRAAQPHLQADIVLGAISTHEGEEALILKSYQELRPAFPQLRLLIVPRHMSGVERIESYAHSHHLTLSKRSQLQADLSDFPAAAGQILIGDTLGEIEFYLGLCDVVFMGGSLVDIGGHNPLEPAYFALPAITGPYYYNFAAQFDDLIAKEGAYLCPSAARLTPLLTRLLSNKAALSAAGLRALEVQQAGRGALERTLNLLEQALKRQART